jgi:hypothetical protein
MLLTDILGSAGGLPTSDHSIMATNCQACQALWSNENGVSEFRGFDIEDNLDGQIDERSLIDI